MSTTCSPDGHVIIVMSHLSATWRAGKLTPQRTLQNFGESDRHVVESKSLFCFFCKKGDGEQDELENTQVKSGGPGNRRRARHCKKFVVENYFAP